MRDGFYLSTYLHIDSLAHLMKIRGRHDQNMSLWKKNGNDITLIHYWELERLTGLKQHGRCFYDVEHAHEVINQLLSEYQLNLSDINEVWGTPGLETSDSYHSLSDYPELSYHSICHLWSAIMMDSEIFYKNNIIGLAVDTSPDKEVDKSVSDKNFYSGCCSINGKVSTFPIQSPGTIWSNAKRVFKMREGSLMALGSASKSELLRENTTSFKTNMTLFNIKAFSESRDYLKELVDFVFSLTKDDEGIIFNEFDNKFTEEENKISMCVKEIQKISIEIMETTIEETIAKYNLVTEETYLAISGGYALNCPTNSYLMSKYKFKGFLAPPCVSDTGISLGMALYAFYRNMNIVNFSLKHAFHGDKSAIGNEFYKKYQEYIKETSVFEPHIAANDVINGPIIWFNGAAEIGPRALGNRSLIADPRKQETKDLLNEVKQREWWRPVAPICLNDKVSDWFEEAYSSPYMLHTFAIKDEKRNMIPVAAHLDDSARVQTITEEENPLLYKLISSFDEKVGIPILCNTSLNDKGEPIINTIEEAMNFALRKGFSIIYINGQRLTLQHHEKFREAKWSKRSISFERFSEEEIEKKIKELNPHQISKENLHLYFTGNFSGELDLTNAKDARRLNIYAKSILNRNDMNSADFLYSF
ncbi:carbamoyltransferase C-terminal domain-containing protein [Paenibacillus camerounensis]|uniref:carbamoyltransferase C-terminal domain-containing protein n=1 Tax=Paenibacillus camerounensis TaxID=1243663 RepID=UPI0005AA5B08|nr:carbamoyltransferase C-terminal domain-containing protein [Paenibacillus camerounensis]